MREMPVHSSHCVTSVSNLDFQKYIIKLLLVSRTIFLKSGKILEYIQIGSIFEVELILSVKE